MINQKNGSILINFKPGDSIYYQNEWRNFRSTELQDLFVRMNEEELKKLLIGDSVWINDEPYHPAGKVYGYTYVKILGMVSDNERIKFTGGTMLNGQIVEDHYFVWPHINVYRILNEERFSDVLNLSPEALIL